MKNFHNERLLVIAPHPDDEIVGCGGLIARVKEDGGKVFVLFLTVGETLDYRPGKRGISTGSERLKEIEKVAKFLRFDDFTVAFPGNDHHLRLDLLPQKELIETIENGKISLNKSKPTIVATAAQDSYNQDHRAAASATLAATRPMPAKFKHLSKMVLTYEEPQDDWRFSEKFSPNFFVALSQKNLNSKVQSLKLYGSQYRDGCHPRSPQTLKSLAALRGSQAGVEFAEAFYLNRLLS